MNDSTTEEVRAIARRLRDYIMVTDRDTSTASDMLTAYADLLERIKADKSAEVRLADYLKSQSGYVCLNDQARRNVANTFLAVAYPDHPPAQAAQVDGFFDGLDRSVAHEPADSGRVTDISRLTRYFPSMPSHPGWQMTPDSCGEWVMFRDVQALAAQGQSPALPAGVPDATEVHAYLPPGYRMATRDGDYWPLFGDAYCTNHAFPTRELAALEAWKQAHKKLNDSMDSIRRFAAAPSAPEGTDHG